CLRALVPEMRENVGDKLQLIEAQEKDPAKQYGPEQLQALRALQKLYAIQACKVAAEILKPEWDGGTCDSISEARRRARRSEGIAPPRADEETQWYAEEFVALQYVAFIRYVLLQMRNFLEFATTGFILLVVALLVYPFEGHRILHTTNLFLFVLLTAGIIIVFAQMDRDPLLSRLSNTNPNQLDWNFAARVASYGILPLLTLLGSQFPAIGNFLFSWVQPTLQAMK